MVAAPVRMDRAIPALLGNGRPGMTGALVRADYAEGTINLAACTRYDTIWFATRHTVSLKEISSSRWIEHQAVSLSSVPTPGGPSEVFTKRRICPESTPER